MKLNLKAIDLETSEWRGKLSKEKLGLKELDFAKKS